MQVCTFASGSSGNAVFVSSGNTMLLLDAGISARRITSALSALGVSPSALSGILLTHEHTDHIAGVATLTKQLSLPIYTTQSTALQLCGKVPQAHGCIRCITPGEGFQLGELWVEAFSTPHDTAGSVGFTLEAGGQKMALATDLGHLTQEVLEAVKGADLLVAESNHDVEWVRSSSYPYYLKQRILGDRGHLSNEAGAALVRHAVEHGTRTVLLAHLSSENNTPVRAREVSALHLCAGGIDPEQDIHLSVAPRSTQGPLYQLKRGRVCSVFSMREPSLC